MPSPDSEAILIQKSTIDCLKNELGWETAYAFHSEALDIPANHGFSTFGRKSYKEVVLTRYFRAALQKLNPWMTAAQMDEAQKRLESRLSTASAMEINEEKYRLIRDGIPVTVKKSGGRQETRLAAVIDFKHPQENHFLAIEELNIDGPLHHRRADIVGFVNGLPLLFVELKKHDVDVENAYTDNYQDYLDTIPQLFYYNAFVMLSNGVDAKIGTLGSKYAFFHEWKRLKEDEVGCVALETMLRGVCRKENFLDLFENFILFDHSEGKTVKILARNHQYLGVNEAVKAYHARKLKDGRLGVFWHTQGSGKSYSMVFLAQKIRRKFEGSPTFVILTDRDELNKQISDTFENCGLLGSKASQFIASSGEDLMAKLRGNPSFIFTLIQKFNHSDVQPIFPDHDIIIMSDEAHRSQYGIFADNMMKLLPTASRIGFTGTPLFANDNITERTFGGYLSVYDFKRAVDDGATVPLYYENRADKIKQLDKPQITQEILEAIEAADLDPSQQDKLEREFAKEIHILTAEDRLRSVAKDFVHHYASLWTSGKAMVVCLNKVTCVRMYNFVQEYWQQEIAALQAQIKNVPSEQDAQEMARKLKWMQETEMAVVISQEQNEIKTFQKWGLDIKPHRKKMEERELDKDFKDGNHPFRVVFVCAMWLTGFDVKTLSCLYLDKMLKAHTLMQAIARANRVADGKSNGLIVDYIGIVDALRKALADYTQRDKSAPAVDPTIDKTELYKRIEQIIASADAFLSERDFDFHQLVNATGFARLSMIQQAADLICESIESRKSFQTYASELERIMKFICRGELSDDILAQRSAIHAIDAELQKKRKHADNTDLMVQINSIVNEYIAVEQPEEGLTPSRRFDISQIDFNLLCREFARSHRKHLILKDLDELIQVRLDKLLFTNPQRMDYYNRYQQIISTYNDKQDQASIEKTFMDLMDLANSMDTEQQRYVREGFSSDEELSVYDLLFQSSLSAQDIKRIKQVSVELLQKVKARIHELDHWVDKQETKASVDNLIRDVLYDGLPDSYPVEQINEYRRRIFEYVYTQYGTAA